MCSLHRYHIESKNTTVSPHSNVLEYFKTMSVKRQNIYLYGRLIIIQIINSEAKGVEMKWTARSNIYIINHFIWLQIS
jgi:hypothetical protein